MIGYIILGVILLAAVLLLTFYFISRSKGKVILELNKKDFVVGETISGKIKLNLKKSVEADSLNLKLVGYRKSSGRNSSSSRKIFETIKQIDGHKTYNVGESNYDFEFKIPEDAKPKIENPVFNTLVKTAQFVGGYRTYWYLTAYLDMKGFNLKKTIKIYIN